MRQCKPRRVPPYNNHIRTVAAAHRNYLMDKHSMLTSELSNKTRYDSLPLLSRVVKVADVELCQNFTAAYYIPVMGSGICSNILYSFPYPAKWLEKCAIVMFAFAVFFFIAASAAFVTACIRYPGTFSRMHFEPTSALFIGALPMGYISIVNFIYELAQPHGIVGCWVLWWIGMAVAFYTAIVTVFCCLILKRNKSCLDDMHATILLPVVTLTVMASSGALMVLTMTSVQMKVVTLVMSFIAWALAISVGYNVMVSLYFTRLFVHKLPSADLIFTTFIPIGMMGQGAYGILLMGRSVMELFEKDVSALRLHNYLSFISDESSQSVICQVIGSSALFASACVSLFLTSFGYLLTVLAVVGTLSKIKPFNKNYIGTKWYIGLMPFRLQFWAMTFPLGTMSLANTGMYRVFHGMKAFRVIGAIYGATITLVVVSCIVGTIYRVVESVRAKEEDEMV